MRHLILSSRYWIAIHLLCQYSIRSIYIAHVNFAPSGGTLSEQHPEGKIAEGKDWNTVLSEWGIISPTIPSLEGNTNSGILIACYFGCVKVIRFTVCHNLEYLQKGLYAFLSANWLRIVIWDECPNLRDFLPYIGRGPDITEVVNFMLNCRKIESLECSYMNIQFSSRSIWERIKQTPTSQNTTKAEPLSSHSESTPAATAQGTTGAETPSPALFFHTPPVPVKQPFIVDPSAELFTKR